MRFSIITVCRNSVNTIEKTFQSVLSQTCQDFEYIVIDGASNDGTVELIKNYARRFASKMQWISEPDGGLYEAMNKGIARASGELMCIVNSDDFLEPGALTDFDHAAQSCIADVYYGIERQLEASGAEHRVIRHSHTRLPMETLWHPSTCIRKSAYQKYGVYDVEHYRFGADYELFVRMFSAGAVFCPVDRIISNFSISGISSRNVRKTLQEALAIRRRYCYLSPCGYFLRMRQVDLQCLFWFPLKRMIRRCFA